MLQKTDTSEYLTSLIDAGADAMSNLFYVEFQNMDNTSSLNFEGSGISIRNKDFKLPKFSQDVHTVNFMTSSIEMPSASWSGEKVLEFEFRVDQNYLLYKKLKKWQSMTSAEAFAYASSFIPGEKNTALGENKIESDGVVIRVYGYKPKANSSAAIATSIGSLNINNQGNFANDNRELLYEFKNCWVQSITGLNYSYDDNKELSVRVKISFATFNREAGLGSVIKGK